MFWPNGKPCTPINSWLASIADSTTGRESTKTAASEITPLVRYCHATAGSFDQFSDNDLYALYNILLTDVKLSKGIATKARETNQIIAIMQRALSFLIWYQNNVRPSSLPPIIGEGRGAQLTVEKKINRRNNSLYYSHAAIPAHAAPSNDKQPIPVEHITRIQDEVFRISINEDSKVGRRSNPEHAAYRKANHAYLYNRRIFMMWLMEFCGLRPEEMVDMSLEANRDPFNKGIIILPTKKTRELPTPVRQLPINSDDANEIVSYLEERDAFVHYLITQGRINTDSGSMFLSEKGLRISKQSLARDFKRVAERAGLTDVKICLSMYRHLFITRQMIYHIQSEINSATNSSKDKVATDRMFFSLRDNQAFMLKICRKITPLTGHKKPSSVEAYFNDAVKILSRFAESHGDVKNINDMHSSMNSLVRIRHQALLANNHEIVHEIDAIKHKWSMLRSAHN
ncbi:tyrosine-type recombinase/integrase [Pseudomonas sp. W5-36]|uniref:tyrosine-type recombinase/integrase n=1 Tax=Pseudomonas sp. W5-36 TaxID=3097455 RepID=UPI003977F21A